ncbi:MAG: hypothetical protein HY066_00555 [Betaproteobacteria bacterium]|nr:hypothetical protein [Betaproteobacteria bacterium]
MTTATTITATTQHRLRQGAVCLLIGLCISWQGVRAEDGKDTKEDDPHEQKRPKVTVSLTVPALLYVAPATVTLTADAQSREKEHPIVRVEFYQGATLIGTVTKAPYTFTWTKVPAGRYSLTAKAYNDEGDKKDKEDKKKDKKDQADKKDKPDKNEDIAVSAAVLLVVDAPPTVALTAPAANLVVTAPGTLTLSANAADSDGTIAKVEFYQGTTLIGTVTAAPYSFVWSNVPAGSYSITAKATDDRGASTTSSAVQVIVNAPPTVTLTSPTPNQVATAPGTLTVTATATDSDGTIAKVEFYQGSTLIGTATAAPYTFVWSAIPAGSYSLTAKATDDQGASTTSTAVNVIVNTPPTIVLTAPAAGQKFTAPASIALAVTAADTDGSVVKVDYFQNGNPVGSATAAPFGFTWSNVPQGSYTLTAQATDDRGAQTTSAPMTVTVNAAGPPLGIYYIHPDHLGTPRLITDSQQNTVWRWDNQEPFGNNPPNEDPGNSGTTFVFNPRFPGQYFDRETNLSYNYFRDYDPNTGRYIQSDPIGLQGGINGYTYVGGNPVSYIDPLGLDRTIWSPGPGRSITDGPRNGNWGGGKWSGGVSGGGTGTAPALDSGDECYQRHDQCFDSGTPKASCNRKLVDELKALPDDPKQWPRPPAPGTEGDSDRFRRGAITIFGR